MTESNTLSCVLSLNMADSQRVDYNASSLGHFLKYIRLRLKCSAALGFFFTAGTAGWVIVGRVCVHAPQDAESFYSVQHHAQGLGYRLCAVLDCCPTGSSHHPIDRWCMYGRGYRRCVVSCRWLTSTIWKVLRSPYPGKTWPLT